MSDRGYCMVSAAVFSVVAVAHLLRSLGGWPLVLGTWPAPVGVSWLAAAAAAALAAWGFRCAGRASSAGTRPL